MECLARFLRNGYATVFIATVAVWLFLPFLAFAQEPVNIDGYVSVSTADEKSTLDRQTRAVTSTVDVIITNTSNRVIDYPLRIVINIMGTDYSNVTMPEALGGPGTTPYGKYYYERNSVSLGAFVIRFGSSQCNTDCTGDLDGDGDVDGLDLALLSHGNKLNPGQQATFHLKFVRKDTVRFQYSIETFGIVEGSTGNEPPVASAGDDQTIEIPLWQNSTPVTLDASQSYDPDGDLAAYRWTCVSASGGNPVDPEDVEFPQVRLSQGVYTFKLEVVDNDGAVSKPDTVTISVVSKEYSPPVINVSPTDYTVEEGEELKIEVSASDDNVRNVTLGAYPLLPNASFTSHAGPSASGTFIFRPDYNQQGFYTVAFKARNDLGLASLKTVNITVKDKNRPPIIDPLEPVSIDEGKAITLHITASDPDQDPVSISATNLPTKNAIFIPSSATFIFAPDYEQSGTYEVTFTASDGKVSSDPVTLTIDVKDVPTTGSNEHPTLELVVNPVESPTLRKTVTLTGRVNSATVTPPPEAIHTALINSLLPASVKQGQTIDINIAGQENGGFETHFEDGATTANFGNGIRVNSIKVLDPHHAVINITVDCNAEVGQRSVILATNNETAVSTIALDVSKGTSLVSGRIVDPDSGNPVAGAVVSIQGTTLSTTTDSEGHFSFNDVPSGKLTLLVNAPDHEFITSSLDISAGKEIDVGDLETKAIVYQPDSKPDATLSSLLGRGITDFTSIKSIEDAEKLVRDAYLLVGGRDIGVLDQYGNQINPKVKGIPYISITDAGIKDTAEALITGETTTVGELLFAFTYLWEWDGERPNLIEWLHAIQKVVNRAWENPDDPESALFILLFNQGKNLSPEPPQIVADTPLNALQAQLMSITLFVTATKTVDPSWVNQQVLERSSE